MQVLRLLRRILMVTMLVVVGGGVGLDFQVRVGNVDGVVAFFHHQMSSHRGGSYHNHSLALDQPHF